MITNEIMIKITRNGKSHYQSVDKTKIELLMMGERLRKTGRITSDEMSLFIKFIRDGRIVELMDKYGQLMNTVSDGLKYEVMKGRII